MRGIAVVVLAVLVASCSASRDDVTFASGSILRAHVWDAGGSRVLIDWHDSRLGIQCRFLTGEDGETRCLPVMGVRVFADAACSDALYVMTPGSGDVPAYFISYAFGAPGAPAYVTGAERTAPAAVYSIGPTGACMAYGGTVGRVFGATHVDAGTFVRAERSVADVGDGLESVTYVADDGARQIAWAQVAARGVVCSLQADVVPLDHLGASGRCFPNAYVPLGSFYTDAACSMPAGLGRSASDVYVERPERMPGTCVVVPRFYELGAPLSTAYQLAADGSCASIDTSASVPGAYTLGAELDASTFPVATLSTIGSGRARAGVTRSAGGAVVAASLDFWDTEADMGCGVTHFADGVVRCVPGTSGVAAVGGLGTPAEWYTDAACTDRVAAVFTCTPQRYDLRRESGVVTEVRELGPVYTGPLYLGTSTTCSPAATGVTGFELHTLGAVVDPDAAFARLVERTE